MPDFGFRHYTNAVASRTHALTVVNIFVIHEIALVQQSNFAKTSATN